MSVDVLIIFGYLILTLLYGLYVGRDVKNISEYAVGGRDFTTAILAATIVATFASSSGFFINITKSYADGLFNLLATSGQILFVLFIAYFIAPRMKPYFGSLSVAEMIGTVYGQNIRIFSSIPVIIKSAGFVAIQIKVLSTTITHFSGIDPQLAVLFTAVIIVTYSAFGGIRAVTLTDFVQFGTFMVTIPLLYAYFWSDLGLPGNTDNKNALIDHLFNLDGNKFNYYLMLFFYFMIPKMNAPDVQRMLMARDTHQISQSYKIAAKLLSAIIVLLSIIGSLVYVTNPELDESEILPFIIEKFNYPGLRGVLFSGIIAMAMSTADSYLNVGSIVFAHDFCRPLGIFKRTNELKIARTFSFICGILAIIFALNFKDLLSLILFVSSVYDPIISVPLLFAIFGFRSTTRAVSVGISFGIITVIFWSWIREFLGLDDSISAFLPGIIAHMIGLFGTHYLLREPGGWTGGSSDNGDGIISGFSSVESEEVNEYSKDDNSYKSYSGYFMKAPTIWDYITQFFSPVRKIFIQDFTGKSGYKSLNAPWVNLSFLELMRHNLPQSSYLYNTLAFYNSCLFLISLTFFGLIDSRGFVLFAGVLLFCFLLISRNLLNDKKGNILMPLYYISCIYTFPFASTYLFLHTQFSPISSFLMIFSLFIMPLLMSWSFAFVGIFVGILSAVPLFSYTEGWSYLFKLISEYHEVLIFIALVVISAKFFISKKSWDYVRMLVLKNEGLMWERRSLENRLVRSEDYIRRLKDLKGEILNNFSHEVRTPLTTTGNFLVVAGQKFRNGSDVLEVATALKDAEENFLKLKDYILRLSDLSSYEREKMQIEKEEILVGEFLKSIISRLKEEFGVSITLEIPKELEEEKFNCDILKIRKVFEELAQNTLKHMSSTQAKISLRDAGSADNNQLIMEYKDYVDPAMRDGHEALEGLKKIDASDKGVAQLFEMFEIGIGNGKKGYKGLGLALSREIIRSHGGDIEGFVHNEQAGGFGVRIKIPKSTVNLENIDTDIKVADSAITNQEVQEKANHKKEKNNKYKRVLLVDDDEVVLRSTKMILEMMGCYVYSASSGVEAVDMIRAGNEIDVMLLDVMMPDMTGIEVLEIVYKELDNRKIRIIIQSGAGIIDEYKEKLDKFGVLYCSKPYSTEQLKAALWN